MSRVDGAEETETAVDGTGRAGGGESSGTMTISHGELAALVESAVERALTPRDRDPPTDGGEPKNKEHYALLPRRGDRY